jgi:hypothetical protein
MRVSVYYTILLVIIAIIGLDLAFTVGTPAFPGATVVEILCALLVVAVLAGIFVTHRWGIRHGHPADRMP